MSCISTSYSWICLWFSFSGRSLSVVHRGWSFLLANGFFYQANAYMWLCMICSGTFPDGLRGKGWKGDSSATVQVVHGFGSGGRDEVMLCDQRHIPFWNRANRKEREESGITLRFVAQRTWLMRRLAEMKNSRSGASQVWFLPLSPALGILSHSRPNPWFSLWPPRPFMIWPLVSPSLSSC